jgi:transposase-like protein
MAEVAVRCPHCQSEAVVKYGKSSNGKERFRGQQREPCGRTFLQTYAYSGCLPTVKLGKSKGSMMSRPFAFAAA